MDESPQGRGIADRIITAFKDVLSITPDHIPEVGVTIPIPTFNSNMLVEIAKRAQDHFASQGSLLQVPKPVYIVGDIHGNIFDLIRVLVMASPPPLSRFLFLGDYVDRGEYSVEVVALLFALAIKYPEHVYVLRGNHEFDRVNAVYGFKAEVEEQLGNLDVYTAYNSCFQWIPLAARVGTSIFCVHGGISPQITSFRQLERIKRPISVYDNHISSDLLWSDPSPDTKDYLRSTRGNGVAFGANAARDFARAFGIKHIIRAHQCVPLGIEKFAGDIVYTVFSCSNYQDSSGNRCGLIFVAENETLQSFSLPPIQQIDRTKVLLQKNGNFGTSTYINQATGSTANVEADRSAFLSLSQQSPKMTYSKKRSSVSSLALPRMTQKRPSTAEPTRPDFVLED